MANGKITSVSVPVIEYKKKSEDLATKTTVEEIDLKGLKEELVELDARLVLIGKEPDEILMPNVGKIQARRMTNDRKVYIEKLLGLCK